MMAAGATVIRPKRRKARPLRSASRRRSEGETLVQDKVQGDVRFPNKDLDDFIILRSDGNPTYMLAVVVDDHDMGVTHIIRGDDHLTNSARQTLIYQAMGWEVPVMAHIPLIHGPDGAKLSKRHGALGIDAYRAMGYLPQALRNYLVRLGWSHGDDEVMSLDQMIEWFALEDINKGAARFDFKKLEALNGHYMRGRRRRCADADTAGDPAPPAGRTGAGGASRRRQDGAAEGGDAWPEGTRERRWSSWSTRPNSLSRRALCPWTKRPPVCSTATPAPCFRACCRAFGNRRLGTRRNWSGSSGTSPKARTRSWARWPSLSAPR